MAYITDGSWFDSDRSAPLPTAAWGNLLQGMVEASTKRAAKAEKQTLVYHQGHKRSHHLHLELVSHHQAPATQTQRFTGGKEKDQDKTTTRHLCLLPQQGPAGAQGGWGSRGPGQRLMFLFFHVNWKTSPFLSWLWGMGNERQPSNQQNNHLTDKRLSYFVCLALCLHEWEPVIQAGNNPLN